MRFVIGEDQALLRQGVVRLLQDAGFDVVAEAGDAPDLLRKVGAHKPDVAIVDVQMPPDNSDDGLRAALEIRARQPGVGVLVLSQFVEERYALDLIGEAGQATRMVALELAPVVVVALLAGAAIAAASVIGVPAGVRGIPLVVPAALAAGLAAGAAALGLAAGAVTARLALRASPAAAMRAQE